MPCVHGYDCPYSPHGVCCGEWNEPIDPKIARLVVDFMESHTGVKFGDMIGRRDRDRILEAARTAQREEGL